MVGALRSQPTVTVDIPTWRENLLPFKYGRCDTRIVARAAFALEALREATVVADLRAVDIVNSDLDLATYLRSENVRAAAFLLLRLVGFRRNSAQDDARRHRQACDR